MICMDRTQAAAATAESSPESDSDSAAAVFWPEWPVPLGPPGCRGAASVFRLPQPELGGPAAPTAASARTKCLQTQL